MAATYDLGDSVKLTFLVKVDGVPTNATAVLTLTKPDGTASIPAVTNPATGTYTATVAPDQAGLWLYRWTATGAATTAEDGVFVVEATLAATLYTTVAEVRDQLGPGGPAVDAGQLEASIRAASRWIDGRCGRRFFQDPTATARVYRPDTCEWTYLDDIATTTGLVVKTDPGLDGTWSATIPAAGYQLEPLNASANGGAYAWWKLVALGGNRLPDSYTGQPTLQVTARWGWSQVPDQIREAATLAAVGLWKRRDAPFGVAGFGEFGAVRITRADPDVERLIAPFVLAAA